MLEQEEGKLRFYIIRNNEGDIVGRINMFDIRNQTAEVGFRVGKKYIGKGIAGKALNLLLNSEVSEKIIKGKTTTNNIASQKVFLKNGFKSMEGKQESFEFNGQIISFLYYIWESDTNSEMGRK